MKKGIAMVGKLSIEVKVTWAMYSMGKVSALIIVASVERPRLMAIGTPMAQSTTKYPKSACKGSMYSKIKHGEMISATQAKPARESTGPHILTCFMRFWIRRRHIRPKPNGKIK